ncbi:hypothetical protein FOL47_002624, partial [Perkinsus chesapeaki]
MAHSHGQVSRDRVALNCPFEKSLLVAEQREDPSIGLLRRRLQRHRWRQEDCFDPRLQPYKSVMCLLAVDEDGLLVRKVRYGDRDYFVPLVPPTLRPTMLIEVHERCGHAGMRRAGQFLRQRCYWPGMNDHLHVHIACCEVCYPSDSEDSISASPFGPEVSPLPAMMAMPVEASHATTIHPVISANLVTPLEQWSKADLIRLQDQDVVLSVVKDRLRSDRPFTRKDMRDAAFRPYRRLWSVLFLDDEQLLVRMVKQLPEEDKTFVPIIPSALRKDVLHRFHDLGGHFGRGHMWEKLRRLCFWPGQNVDIADYVAACERCLVSKAKQKPPAFLVPFP